MDIFDGNRKFTMGDSLKEQLLRVARNQIRISYSPIEETDSDVCSKFGGEPAVPEEFVWPVYTGKRFTDTEAETRPLAFMAQINLAEAAKYDTEDLLPKTGLLSFFYEMVTMKWGMQGDDRDFVKVYYFPDVSCLERMEIPEEMEEEGFIPELRISFESEISLPYPDNFYDEDFDLNEFDECCNELGYEFDEMGDRTKLLGYPDVIQEPMEEDCEIASRGYSSQNPDDPDGAPEEELEDIKEKAKEWMLLFQMGTIESDEAEIMFGDCGHIYFWIKKDDLKARIFERIGFVLQCG